MKTQTWIFESHLPKNQIEVALKKFKSICKFWLQTKNDKTQALIVFYKRKNFSIGKSLKINNINPTNVQKADINNSEAFEIRSGGSKIQESVMTDFKKRNLEIKNVKNYCNILNHLITIKMALNKIKDETPEPQNSVIQFVKFNNIKLDSFKKKSHIYIWGESNTGKTEMWQKNVGTNYQMGNDNNGWLFYTPNKRFIIFDEFDNTTGKNLGWGNLNKIMDSGSQIDTEGNPILIENMHTLVFISKSSPNEIVPPNRIAAFLSRVKIIKMIKDPNWT